MGEGFFKSVGFDPLPDTFWKRSMFVRPKDRDVVCHALGMGHPRRRAICGSRCVSNQTMTTSAPCITSWDTTTTTGTTGSSAAVSAGANDGFHEAIGDAIALSITPTYLQKLVLWIKVRRSMTPHSFARCARACCVLAVWESARSVALGSVFWQRSVPRNTTSAGGNCGPSTKG